jgi:putative sigma-54 modulation protein
MLPEGQLGRNPPIPTRSKTMRVSVTARRIQLSDAVHDYLDRRVYFALGRFAAAIRAVKIILCDENGPRGGADKRCQVQLALQYGPPLIVTGRGSHITPLIDHTVDRAGRMAARAIKRKSSRS